MPLVALPLPSPFYIPCNTVAILVQSTSWADFFSLAHGFAEPESKEKHLWKLLRTGNLDLEPGTEKLKHFWLHLRAIPLWSTEFLSDNKKRNAWSRSSCRAFVFAWINDSSSTPWAITKLHEACARLKHSDFLKVNPSDLRPQIQAPRSQT